MPERVMSMLCEEAVNEFKALYEKDTDTKLSNKESVQRANDLFNALETLLTYEDE